MAEKFLTDVSLKLQFISGVDEKDEPIIKSKTFRNISASAAEDNLSNVSIALDSLTDYELHDVEKNETYKIA